MTPLRTKHYEETRWAKPHSAQVASSTQVELECDGHSVVHQVLMVVEHELHHAKHVKRNEVEPLNARHKSVK
jgi:hypothetical protein